jgi:hypothetical protein
MCYLTYYPLDAETAVFTSNRDEKTQRSRSSEIHQTSTPNGALFYPKVENTNGSWIAFRKDGAVAVLLNGAFIAHQKKPFYRHSRGEVLMQLFHYETFAAFAHETDLFGIEPFTIVFKTPQKDDFWELKWNGEEKFIKKLPTDEPLSWSSATLYSPEIQVKRDQWFKHFLKAFSRSHTIQPSDILHFQRTKTENDPQNALLMQREEQQTVSITQIIVGKDFCQLYYDNLIINEQQILSF